MGYSNVFFLDLLHDYSTVMAKRLHGRDMPFVIRTVALDFLLIKNTEEAVDHMEAVIKGDSVK
jgi:hypothetical protein